MMADRLDDILRQALAPAEEPAETLNQRIFRRVEEEKKIMTMRKRNLPAAAIVAALVLGLGSVSAFAAARLLAPAQVTEIMGDEKLTKVFSGEDGIYVGESQSLGGYEVTFLGIASGKNISDSAFYQDGALREDRSYMVVSIANADGTLMPDTSSDAYDISDFFVTPLIRGCDPVWYNAFTFGGAAATETVVDGVRYRLMECDSVEMFADRELYLGVMDSMSYNAAAYLYDAESGKISRNETYRGLNALFKLPIPAAKADPEAAEAYLEELRKELFPDQEGSSPAAANVNEAKANEAGSNDATAADEAEYWEQMKEIWGDRYDEWRSVEDWCAKLTPENIDEYAVPVESTRKILTPDTDGYISNWDYEIEGVGGGEGGRSKIAWLFQTSPTVLEYSNSGTMDSVIIRTFTLNADGTVTFVAYIPKDSTPNNTTYTKEIQH